jgi:predicted anti-sigma-YlaC factor YlaD
MNRYQEMDCERIEAMLPAFVGRDLGADDAAVVSSHLETCAQCRESLAAFAALEQSLVARRDDVPPVDAFLPHMAPARARSNVLVRCLRAVTSVPGIAIVIVMWAGFLIARYSDRLTGDAATQKNTFERMTALAQRGIDAMIAAAGGDVWTLTAVYGALAIGVIVSAGALTMRLVRD